MSHLTPVPNDPEELRAWLAQLGRSRLDTLLDTPTNPEITLPRPPEVVGALTVKLTLKGTKPPVWRRLVMAGDTTLDEVHDILQVTMGWEDGHLHRFHVGPSGRDPGFVTEEDLDEGEDGTSEGEVRLDQVLRAPGDRILYEYDFGDGWDHELRLEQVGALPEDPRPRCLAGRLACPPEDCGGTGAYAELATWVRAGRPADDVPAQFESLEHATDWLPPWWDPDAFDAAEVDLMLHAEDLSEALLDGLRPDLAATLLQVAPEAAALVSTWLESAGSTTLAAADLEDVTHPHRTFLSAVGSGLALSAAGYLPPVVVGQLCPALDIDPVLAGQGNRESNVGMLLRFRTSMQAAGLLRTHRKRLVPTAKGTQYVDAPAELWRHLATRLPLGRTDLDREVGWFTLLALAGGADRVQVFERVRGLCTAAGWVDDEGRPMSGYAAARLTWPTLAALLGPRWNGRGPWPGWVAAAAAEVLFAAQP